MLSDMRVTGIIEVVNLDGNEHPTNRVGRLSSAFDTCRVAGVLYRRQVVSMIIGFMRCTGDIRDDWRLRRPQTSRLQGIREDCFNEFGSSVPAEEVTSQRCKKQILYVCLIAPYLGYGFMMLLSRIRVTAGAAIDRAILQGAVLKQLFAVHSSATSK